MSEKIFEILDHPSDLLVKIYARSADELIRNCVFTFGRLVLGEIPPSERTVVTFRVRGRSVEELVLDLFSKMITELEGSDLLPVEASRITGKIPGGVVVQARAHKLKGNEDYSNVIKAVTYHDLRYQSEMGYLTVLFDL